MVVVDIPRNDHELRALFRWKVEGRFRVDDERTSLTFRRVALLMRLLYANRSRARHFGAPARLMNFIKGLHHFLRCLGTAIESSERERRPTSVTTGHLGASPRGGSVAVEKSGPVHEHHEPDGAWAQGRS